MKEQIKVSEEYATLAKEVFDTHEDVQWIRDEVSVCFMKSNKRKINSKTQTNAECIKVKDLYKEFVPYDFLIVVYQPNVEAMTEEQLKILLYHELLHIGVTGEGENRRYTIAKHDLEDFRKVIDRYGTDWAR